MRARSGWGFGLATVGALCLIAAAILAWVVVPNRKQLPADTDTTRQFSGTAKVLLNAPALASGNLREAVLVNTPVTAQRVVKVQATDGADAQVSDQRTLNVKGQPVGQTQATYAVDRKSLEAASNVPSGWQVTPHEGLTVSWPIGAQKQQYTGWVNETQSTVPIQYDREENHGGVNTYVYTAKVASAPIKDQQVLAGMPAQLPVSALSGLAAVLPIPPEVQAGLAQALPKLTDPIKLSYTYESSSTYWVEPTTGIVVDTQREDIRKAGIGAGSLTLPGVPVYDVETKFTDQSVTDAGNEAKDAKTTISTVGTTLPWILTVVGVLALAGGLLLVFMGRGRGRGGMTPATAGGYPTTSYPATGPTSAGPATPATPPPPPPSAGTPPPSGSPPMPPTQQPPPSAGPTQPPPDLT